MGAGSGTCCGVFVDAGKFGGSRVGDFEGRTLGAKVSNTLDDGVLEVGVSLGGSSTTGLGKTAEGGFGGCGVGGSGVGVTV